jgi:hypothetical protein
MLGSEEGKDNQVQSGVGVEHGSLADEKAGFASGQAGEPDVIAAGFA